MDSHMLKKLEKYDVVRKGHFLLPSGKHSDRYVQCAKLMQYPDVAGECLKVVADKILSSELSFDTVLGPAVGGILVAYELARQLEKPVVYAERVCGVMELSEGSSLSPKSRVLIAEDVVTSGNTARETIELIDRLGAETVAVACIVNKESLSMDKRIYSFAALDFKSFDSKDCLMCSEDLPLMSGK